MSTIVLIIAGLIAAVALLIGIGYLLEKYGAVDKVKEAYAAIRSNYPTLRRWLIIGGIALLLLLGLIALLWIIL
jgi:hypothetical protein